MSIPLAGKPCAAPSLRRVACAVAMLVLTATGSGAQRVPYCTAMLLPLAGIEAPPPQYRAFCEREPGACVMDGDTQIGWTLQLQLLLGRVNRDVNAAIRLVPDAGVPGQADIWCFPAQGTGDCEDLALEKRRQLVEAGLPAGALTLATGFHEVQFFPHAVLLVETDAGTWVLDSLHDEVLCWDALAYRYTRRERPDGMWDRFLVQ